MGIDGVRAVNYVSITQGQDYEGGTGGESFSPNRLWPTAQGSEGGVAFTVRENRLKQN